MFPMITPDSFFSILSDSTRLRILMLVQAEDEVCVCELTYTLDESQPKVSRHLALMREAGILESRREGTWMFYRIHQGLPGWAKEIIRRVFDQLTGLNSYCADRARLSQMSNRPEDFCA